MCTIQIHTRETTKKNREKIEVKINFGLICSVESESPRPVARNLTTSTTFICSFLSIFFYLHLNASFESIH